ncbi:biosynthetic arginine decarboxylase, partial [Myxococcota bacterium]|nr:biosynthetic arginine decarboxylase [Myxococcota bacterium]
FGKKVGLEAGSKTELLASIAMQDAPDGIIICNGYKDKDYIATALLSRRLGRHTIIVVDRFAEVELIIRESRRLGVKPAIGFRTRLNSRGAGKWVDSTGDKSKFGLSALQLIKAVNLLKEAKMLDSLVLLHFHIGSQITAIRAIKNALREASRIYAELYLMGAALKYIDVGGGLGVDYDGSQTNFHSSTDYTLQEYANDVVSGIQTYCDQKEVPHPVIITESGRALVAHHALLIFNVLGVNQLFIKEDPASPAKDEAEVVHDLYEVWKSMTRKNLQESFHDALEHKEVAGTMFNLGYLDLKGRGRAESIFWACCSRALRLSREVDRVPEELEGLERALCDTYYCNFSVFQSAPDHWAMKQLFPTLPIHRHKEKPTQRAVLADLTCDSDGKIDQFIDLHDVKDVLELHPFKEDEPYYIGLFLLGAYQ